MGVEIKIGSGNVPGAGNVSWKLQVTKNANGDVMLRVLQEVRLLDEGGKMIGSEDPRYAFVARHLGAM